MRILIIVPLCLAAACSGGGGEENAAVEAADALQAGQWEITSEVTTFNKVDQGIPKIDMPVGTKETTIHCVTEADAKRPAPALFAGTGDNCKYRDVYLRGGRISAGIDCTRSGLSGQASANFANATGMGPSGTLAAWDTSRGLGFYPPGSMPSGS